MAFYLMANIYSIGQCSLCLWNTSHRMVDLFLFIFYTHKISLFVIYLLFLFLGIPFSSSVDMKTRIPSFYRGTFNIPNNKAGTMQDTFFAFPGWSKGFCVVNGFNLGRYWKIGPQHTLYVPGPILREGANEFIVFEESSPAPFISSIPYAIL